MIGYESKARADGKRLFFRSSDLWLRQEILSADADVDVTAGSPNSVVVEFSGTPFADMDLEDGKLVIAGEDWVITENTDNTVTATRAGTTVVEDDEDVPVRVMSALRFAGFSEGKNFGLEDEYAEYKTGVPRKLVAKALLERTLTLAGELVMSGGLAGFRTLAMMTGMKEDEDTTDKFRATAGSNPSERPYFEVSYKLADKSGKDAEFVIYYGQFEIAGDIGFDDEEAKKIGYTFVAYADPLRASGGTTDDEDLFEFTGEL